MSQRKFAFLTAATVFALDRTTKLLVQALVPLWETHRVIPGFFDIVHTENAGAAFSLLARMESVWRRAFLVGSSAVAVVLISLIISRGGGMLGKSSRALNTGLALILGGALGNLYDRAIPGTVTDFLDVYVGRFHWPAFNVADSAITIGAALVLLDLLLARRAPQKA
jgi:signal peptidase II